MFRCKTLAIRTHPLPLVHQIGPLHCTAPPSSNTESRSSLSESLHVILVPSPLVRLDSSRRMAFCQLSCAPVSVLSFVVYLLFYMTVVFMLLLTVFFCSCPLSVSQLSSIHCLHCGCGFHTFCQLTFAPVLYPSVSYLPSTVSIYGFAFLWLLSVYLKDVSL